MSKTFKHVHRFDTNRSSERKKKANSLRRKDDSVFSLTEEESVILNSQNSASKPLSDKNYHEIFT